LGVEKDFKKGVKYWRLAAGQDYPLALAELGKAHAKGIGVKKSGYKALKYWQGAAKLGDPTARLLLLGMRGPELLF
jgi:TPR repeat protein